MIGKKVIVGSAIALAAIICAGAASDHAQGDVRDAVLVEEVYIVKDGDTLWGIAEEYIKKNTGSRRHIIEYKEGIYENNPWLVDRKGLIRPGDELRMTYWVKEGV